MKFYFAPLMGVTGYVYRNAHYACYGNIDKYFAPFISPTKQGMAKNKDFADILPEHNQGIVTIPQILTNNSDYFIKTCLQLKELGYDEVNLNLGCPSAAVVSRGRGSGFLAKREELDSFLDDIFTADIMKISVKTRLGKEDPAEFYDLIKIFNKYTMEELIIHARVQKDFYGNTPNRKVFYDGVKESKNPVCYNGDIFTVDDYVEFRKECPEVDRVMIGRGILQNPGLTSEIRTGIKSDKSGLKNFHNQVYLGYMEALQEENMVLARMKQFWFYVSHFMLDGEGFWVNVKGCEELGRYLRIVESEFEKKIEN